MAQQWRFILIELSEPSRIVRYFFRVDENECALRGSETFELPNGQEASAYYPEEDQDDS